MTEKNDSSAAATDDSGSTETESIPKTQSGAAPAAPAAPAERASTSAEPAADALAVVTAERDKLRDQLLRTAADFDNYRKRSKRDVDDAKQRGKDDIVRELLPVFDNLERAVQTADSASDIRSVIDGVRMVLKLFQDTAERMGLTRVPTVGERFDPAVHEAIQQQETDAQPPGTIIAEVAPGYSFGQRLVRPAMVVVARKPAEQKPAEPKTDGAGAAGSPAAPPAGASGASDASGTSVRPKASQRPPAATDGGEQAKVEQDAGKTE